MNVKQLGILVMCVVVLLLANPIASLAGDDDTNKVEASKSTFLGLHFVSGRFPHELSVSVGEFTLSGPREDTLRPLPAQIRHLAYDAVQKRYYGIASHEVHLVDVKAGTSEKLDLPAELPELSWPCGIAFDSGRQRVVVASLGGVGYLYACSTKTQEWSVIADLNNVDLAALTYDTANDWLYGLHRPHGQVAELIQYNGNGAAVKRIRLDSADLPDEFGAAQLRPPVHLAMHEGLVIAITESQIFAVNPSTGSVRPTLKKR